MDAGQVVASSVWGVLCDHRKTCLQFWISISDILTACGLLVTSHLVDNAHGLTLLPLPRTRASKFLRLDKKASSLLIRAFKVSLDLMCRLTMPTFFLDPLIPSRSYCLAICVFYLCLSMNIVSYYLRLLIPYVSNIWKPPLYHSL